MSSCGICYCDLKDYEICKMGCCSLELCIGCIKDYKICGQCRAPYFWSDIIDNIKNEYETEESKYQKEMLYLNGKIHSLTENNILLVHKYNVVSNNNKFLKVDLELEKNKNEKLNIENLVYIQYINNQANDEKKKKDLEILVQKYNLF